MKSIQKWFSFVFILIFMNNLFGQNFLTLDVYSRILKTKYQNMEATTFLIENDSINYFVTARHLINDKKNNDTITIQVLREGKWEDIQGKLLLHQNENVDIAVIKPDSYFGFVSAISIVEKENYYVGEEGYFLGFPLSIETSMDNVNGLFPTALLKKAILSGGTSLDKDTKVLLLDGHNNAGFSGGPVFFKNDSAWSLIGVISGYLNENKIITTPQGKIVFNENSGIIIVFATNNIKEIIDRK